ncbi:hypothetical protein BD289DRAFT_448419, partial [Coniella lustricola]
MQPRMSKSPSRLEGRKNDWWERTRFNVLCLSCCASHSHTHTPTLTLSLSHTHTHCVSLRTLHQVRAACMKCNVNNAHSPNQTQVGTPSDLRPCIIEIVDRLPCQPDTVGLELCKRDLAPMVMRGGEDDCSDRIVRTGSCLDREKGFDLPEVYLLDPLSVLIVGLGVL